MRIWIRASTLYNSSDSVDVSTDKYGYSRIVVCRKHMSRLLRGSSKRLPRHGSDEVVEVELEAK